MINILKTALVAKQRTKPRLEAGRSLYDTLCHSLRGNLIKQRKELTKMNTRELLKKITSGLLIVHFEEDIKTDAELELLLERVKFLWLQERPQTLHTLN